jgi:hypothetical protein
MVNGAELGTGGPDLLGPVYAPRGNIQVHSPYLEVSAFNPRCRAAATGRKQEKRGWVPLSILSPGYGVDIHKNVIM